MRTDRIWGRGMVVALATAVAALPQAQAQSRRAEKIQKIACVDIPAVLEAVSGPQEARKQLEAMRQEFQRRRTELEREIQQLTAQAGGNLAPQTAIELNARIVAKRRELAEFVETSNKELSATEQELLKPILRKIQAVVRTVAIRGGYSMVVDRSSAVVYVNREYDLTDEVIKELKREFEAEALGGRRD